MLEANPRRVGRDARSVALGLAMLLSLASASALAGPPLVSDDPHTVGAGRVELILAVDALDQGRSTSVGPVLDLTLGLVEALDATLVVMPVSELRPSGSTVTSEFVEVGLKWQPLLTERWNAAFTPAFATTVTGQTRFDLILPVQLEVALPGDVAVGGDGGFTFHLDEADAWRAGVYANWQALPRLALLGELWSNGLASRRETLSGIGGGFDWQGPFGLHLMAAGGTGIVSDRVQRIDWYGYLGLFWAFDAW